MKRILKYGKATSQIIMLALTLTLVVACGSSVASEGETTADSPARPVELVIWHDKEEAIASVLESYLDTLQPEIIVTMERKHGLTETLKLVGNDPRVAPDFYFFAHDKLGVYAEMGILAPITDFVSEEDLEAFLPMTIYAATYRGNVYQLPIYFETLLFMYNRALMSDDEVPTTTEELYAFMRSGAGGRFGFIEQHSTAYFSAGWIHGFGGVIITEDGIPMLNAPETLAALEYRLKFVERMPGETEYATVNALFREGRAASLIGGPWLVPSIRASGVDLGLALMPTVSETGFSLSPFSGVQGLHVLRVAAENPEKNPAIREVLQMLLNTDIGVAMAIASGCAPALTAAYELDVIRNDEMVMKMRETAETAIPMPNIPEMDIMWTVLGNLLVDVNMRSRDIQEAADDAQRRAEDLIRIMRGE
ncbi:MAG: extracellular solute-binding protein [Oscillospiraceae bacterium]|nr:extracellular solute-binding protein [Oscillospiraceae bacterium]MCL2278679.1 extracellular solute-binding protein [Oscillospiraceae bacterium]